jgi:hypothetical protein
MVTMQILGLILILVFAYFNLKNEVTICEIAYFLIGAYITFKGFSMLTDTQALLEGIGLVALGLFVMKPPFIYKGKV